MHLSFTPKSEIGNPQFKEGVIWARRGQGGFWWRAEVPAASLNRWENKQLPSLNWLSLPNKRGDVLPGYACRPGEGRKTGGLVLF